jgi:predicted dehydrogenase
VSDKLGALVVGCGRIAGGFNATRDDAAALTHALAYLHNPRFELRGCVEPDAAVRAVFVERWGPVAAFATLEAALASDLVFDVASVCVPTALHLPVLEALVASEVRAVFAEKPLGGDANTARACVARYRAAGKPLAVAYLRRWDRTMAALRAEIVAGAWGAFRAASVFYGRGIVNNGSHAIDLLNFLVGQKLRLAAATGIRHDGVAGDPTVDAVLATQSGQCIHLVALDGRDCATFELTLAFEGGLVAIEEGGLYVSRRRVGPSRHFAGVDVPQASKREASHYGAAFVAALDDLADCLANGGTPASDGDSALDAIELACTIRAAAVEMEKLA